MIYTTILKHVFKWIYGPPAALPADRGDVGLVLIADGVGGLDFCGTALEYLVSKATPPLDARTVRWGHGLGRWFADLSGVENHQKHAEETARDVTAFRREHPDGAIFLVGKSGGTAIVTRALELIPPGTVEAAVLLAPALSPEYDLAPALRAVRREIVVFWSPLDVFVLGIGTLVFGTVDRKHSVAAGMVGFRPDAMPNGGLDQSLRAKLTQIRWRPSMATTGNLGGHVGPDCPAFLRRYVVPLLRVGATARPA